MSLQLTLFKRQLLPGRCLLILIAALAMATARAGNARDGGQEMPAASIQIELQATAMVDHAQVTLADIAHISGPNNAIVQRLKNLPLGAVPRSGEVVHLERDMLARWIRTRIGLDSADFAWSGAAVNDVRLRIGQLAGDSIAQQARLSLQAAVSAKGMRADIGVSQAPQDLAVPAGALELRVRAFADASLMAKHQSAWVDIWIDGVFLRTVPVGLEVSVFGPAYVLTKNMSEGQAVEPTALAVREVEWSGHASLPLPVAQANATQPGSEKTLETLRARRSLRAGETLTRAAVETAPLVQRGDFATLRSGQGGLELESRVEVLEDGGVGQTVRVKLPNASSSIMARVSGPGTVEIRE